MHHLAVNKNMTRFWIKDQIPEAMAGNVRDYGRTITWWPSDAKETYKAKGNLYKPTDFGYTVNSRGYRSMEFDPKSSKPKLMFVGCSFTTGIGVPYESVYTSIVTDMLSKHFNVEFEQHNLGLPGYGSDAMAQVVYQTVDIIKPELVVVLFPGMQRRQYYNNYHHRIALIPNVLRTNFFVNEQKALITLQTDANDFYNWVMNWQFIELVLRGAGIPWIWGDFQPINEIEPFLYDYVRTDNMVVDRFPSFIAQGDYGRDMMHPGPRAHAAYAKFVFDMAKDALEKKWSSTA
jgi:hypothetical protein